MTKSRQRLHFMSQCDLMQVLHNNFFIYTTSCCPFQKHIETHTRFPKGQPKTKKSNGTKLKTLYLEVQFKKKTISKLELLFLAQQDCYNNKKIRDKKTIELPHEKHHHTNFQRQGPFLKIQGPLPNTLSHYKCHGGELQENLWSC